MPHNFSGKRPKPTSAAPLPQVPAAAEVDHELQERRKATRLLPCPDVLESNDEESWSQWSELMARTDPVDPPPQ